MPLNSTIIIFGLYFY